MLALIGREFKWGVSDCYTIVSDYYKSQLGITCGDIERGNEDWWLDYGNRFEQTYLDAGFLLATYPQENDMLVMAINSKVPNHFAILLGDNMILHHLDKRLSCIEPLNGLYAKSIVCVLRRKELT